MRDPSPFPIERTKIAKISVRITGPVSGKYSEGAFGGPLSACLGAFGNARELSINLAPLSGTLAWALLGTPAMFKPHTRHGRPRRLLGRLQDS